MYQTYNFDKGKVNFTFVSTLRPGTRWPGRYSMVM